MSLILCEIIIVSLMINHAEGVLIVNNIIHGVLFVQTLEKLIDGRNKNKQEEEISEEEIDAAVDWYYEMMDDIARGK